MFIGGYRNDNESLSAELLDWLNLGSKDVIYLSMGTLLKVEPDKIQELTQQVRKQNRYRVIWSLSVATQAIVSELGLSSDSILNFSKYLPQYTLLGHPKIKFLWPTKVFYQLWMSLSRKNPLFVCRIWETNFTIVALCNRWESLNKYRFSVSQD